MWDALGRKVLNARSADILKCGDSVRATVQNMLNAHSVLHEKGEIRKLRRKAQKK